MDVALTVGKVRAPNADKHTLERTHALPTYLLLFNYLGSKKGCIDFN
jgi:hypothetical protein